MDRGAWRATVHGVTKSWAQVKQLSTHTHSKDNSTSPKFLVWELNKWIFPKHQEWYKWDTVGTNETNVSFFSCCLSDMTVEQPWWVSSTCSLNWFIFLHSLKLSPLPLFIFFPSSFRVSQPLTFNCWVSAKHLCVWHQIWQSPRKRIHGDRDSQGYPIMP